MTADLYRGSHCVCRGVRVKDLEHAEASAVTGAIEWGAETIEPGGYRLHLYDGTVLDIRLHEVTSQGKPQFAASAAFTGEIVEAGT